MWGIAISIGLNDINCLEIISLPRLLQYESGKEGKACRGRQWDDGERSDVGRRMTRRRRRKRRRRMGRRRRRRKME